MPVTQIDNLQNFVTTIVTTFNTSYTLTAGVNRVLMACISLKDSGTPTITAATYNSVDMNISSANSQIAGNSRVFWIFLKESGLPVSGANTFSVTFSEVVSDFRCSIFSVPKLDQSQSDFNASVGNTTTSSPNITNITLTTNNEFVALIANSDRTTRTTVAAGTNSADLMEIVDLITGVDEHVYWANPTTSGTKNYGVTFNGAVDNSAMRIVSWKTFTVTPVNDIAMSLSVDMVKVVVRPSEMLFGLPVESGMPIITVNELLFNLLLDSARPQNTVFDIMFGLTEDVVLIPNVLVNDSSFTLNIDSVPFLGMVMDVLLSLTTNSPLPLKTFFLVSAQNPTDFVLVTDQAATDFVLVSMQLPQNFVRID